MHSGPTEGSLAQSSAVKLASADKHGAYKLHNSIPRHMLATRVAPLESLFRYASMLMAFLPEGWTISTFSTEPIPHLISSPSRAVMDVLPGPPVGTCQSPSTGLGNGAAWTIFKSNGSLREPSASRRLSDTLLPGQPANARTCMKNRHD